MSFSPPDSNRSRDGFGFAGRATGMWSKIQDLQAAFGGGATLRTNFWGAWCALLVLLGPQVARAQNVVVLEFSGDKRGRLRVQVERALKRAKKVDVVSLSRYKAQAARKRLRGARAMTPQAVSRLSTVMKLDAAVEGAVGGTFFVRILDPQGNELWSKDLPVRRGAISSDNARRLAQAIYAAAKVGATRRAKADPPEEEAEAPEAEAGPETPSDVPTDAPTRPPEVAAQEPPKDAPDERARREQESMAESHTITEVVADPDLELEEMKKPRVGPRLITFRLGAVSTWRSYCSRPGVLNCKDYDTLPEEQKLKDTVDFTSRLPYFGFGGTVDLFPMANFNNFAKGIGVSLGYSRGFSLTEVTSNSPEAPREVIASDEAYSALLLARWYFGVGSQRNPMSGFLGARVGVDARNFDVDVAANTPLPGSHRRYFVVGGEAGYPLARWFRPELGGAFFLNPRAGPEEVAGYGQTVEGFGFAIEGGFGGELAGPFGYTARFRITQYRDRFAGVGTKWTQTDKGVAQEAYTSVFVTANAQF
jgi:hypothetical protein